MKVLVVDDAPVMRIVLRDILIKFCKIQPEDIAESEDGTTALVKFEVMRPDLVLLDVIMPDMEGPEVVEKMKAIDPDAIIVMCTSSSDEGDIKECLEAGARDYILKPPQPGRVLQAVTTVRAKLSTSN